jgi:hypothetical protein
MNSKQKKTDKPALLDPFKVFIVFLGLPIFGIFVFFSLFFLNREYEKQRLANLLQISTSDEIVEIMLTRYPFYSSTHDDFDALFSSVKGYVSYLCGSFREYKTECPKNQCHKDYTCAIGGDYVFEISFTQSGEVTAYRIGYEDDLFTFRAK